MRANSKPVSVIGPRPSSIQRHYWLCSMLEATICRTIRPYDLARKSLCAQAANKARRLHSPKAKQYPARLLCISMLKHAETMVGWEPDVAHRTLYVEKHARKQYSPWHSCRPKQNCKYPTALIDKERSSDNTVWCCVHKFMRPMTAGTSLSEAALGRPSLLQAAACYPSLSEAAVVITSLSEAGSSTGTRHQHQQPVSTTCTASSQHQHQHRRPAPSTSNLSPPRAHPARPCPHHVHSQLTAPPPAPAPGPAPAPCLHHVHTQLTAPAPAPGTSTSNLSQPRAQPAHSTSTGTSTSNLSPPHAQPAHSTSTSTGTQHQQPVSKARTGNSLLFEVRTP